MMDVKMSYKKEDCAENMVLSHAALLAVIIVKSKEVFVYNTTQEKNRKGSRKLCAVICCVLALLSTA